MTQPLFPIDAAKSFIESFAPQVQAGERALRWPAHGGTTELTVERIQESTPDGLEVTELVTLRHTSPSLLPMSLELAGLMNKWATLGAVVPASGGLPTELVSKVGIFSTDQAAAERLYAPLICMHAAYLGWHAQRLAQGRFHLDDLREAPVQTPEASPPFNAADFEALKAMTDRQEYLGFLSNDHYTVELPWDFGAVSHAFRADKVRAELQTQLPHADIDQLSGKTSLVQILAMSHPLYGQGIQCRLEIPEPAANEAALSKLVDELNRWELSGADLPPLLGAWCAGDRAPAFVTFVPTQLCVPGLLQNLLIWSIARHARVRGWLVNASTACH